MYNISRVIRRDILLDGPKLKLTTHSLVRISFGQEKKENGTCRIELELALMDCLRSTCRLDCQHNYRKQFPDGVVLNLLFGRRRA